MAKTSKKPPQPEPENQPYKVGYGKPPLETRFQPGVSPNPNGRPKGAQNVGTDLREELTEPITVQEGGKTKKISKRRAIVKSIVNNSIKNNGRAVDALIKMMDRAGIPFEDAGDHPVTEDDAILVQMLIERQLRRQAQKTAEDEDDTPSEEPVKKSLKKPNRKE
jgi:hypothetical protein